MAKGPSIGIGIGLQGQPDLHENIGMQELAYQRQKKARKEKEDKAILDRYRGALKTKGYDAIYNTNISAGAGKVIDLLQKHQSDGTLHQADTDPELMKAFSDFQQYAGNAKVNSEKLAAAEQYLAQHQGKVAGNEELWNDIRESRIQGKPVGLVAQQFGEDGLAVDQNTLYKPIEERLSFNELTTKTLSPFTEAKAKKGGGWRYDEGQRVMVNTDTVTYTLAQAEDLLKAHLREPKWAKTAVNEFNDLSEDERAKYADPEDYIIKEYAPRLVVEDVKSRGSKSGDSGYSKKEADEVTSSTKKVVVGGDGGTNQVEVTEKGNFSLKKPIKLTLTLSKDAIDKDSNSPLNVSETNKDVYLGEPSYLPVAKENSAKYGLVKGQAIGDDNLSKLPSDLYDYKVMASASYTEERPVYDTNGDVVYKDVVTVAEDGTETVDKVAQTRNVEHSYYVPMDEVKNTYNQNGYKNPVNALYSKAEEANKSKGGTSSSGTPKEGDVKTLSSGTKVKFNGTKWVPVQ